MTLLSGNAQSSNVSLRSLRDHQRVLLVFSNGNNQPAEAQLAVAAEHTDGFRERDLVLVGLHGSNPAVPAGMLSATEDAEARRRFHVHQGEFTVLLIGKDGGVKLRAHQPLDWDKLRGTIDAMPMRQAEIERKKQ